MINVAGLTIIPHLPGRVAFGTGCQCNPLESRILNGKYAFCKLVAACTRLFWAQKIEVGTVVKPGLRGRSPELDLPADGERPAALPGYRVALRTLARTVAE